MLQSRANALQSVNSENFSRASKRFDSFRNDIIQRYDSKSRKNFKFTKAMEQRYIQGIVNLQKALVELERELSIEAREGDVSDSSRLQRVLEKCKKKRKLEQRLLILKEEEQLILRETYRVRILDQNVEDQHKLISALNNIYRKVNVELLNMAAFSANCVPQ